MKATLGAIALCSSLALPSAALADEAWIADFDAAAALAKKEGKSLLVDFTGSDWCGWCKRLDREVFAQREFLEEARRNFVLVALDFPSGRAAKAKVPNPRRNDELKVKYEIKGFPTILLMTADGEVFGRTGYQAGGAEKYVEHLDELLKGRPVIGFLARYEAAKDSERAQLLGEAIALMDALPFEHMMAPKLKPVIAGAIAADPENAKGLRARAVKALLKSGSGDAAVAEAAEALDPKNEQGILEWAVRFRIGEVNHKSQVAAACERIDEFDALGRVHDEAAALLIWLHGARFNAFFQKDPAKAKHYARKARAIGVDDPQLEKMLSGILAG